MQRMHTMTLALAAFATAASAQPHQGDIILADIDGRIVTGLGEDGSDPIFPIRVFESEFEQNFTDEPGFDTDADAFPPFSTIGFNIRRALREWNGDFDAICDERIAIRSGPFGPVLTPETDELVAGFGIEVNSGGEWHHHLGFSLLDPADDGIYLLELEMWSDQGDIGPSEPFWIVFGNSADPQELEDAVHWVEDNLIGNCPADLTGDGSLDADDFFLYLDLFASGDDHADIDGNGSIDADDFFAYLDLFAAGDPGADLTGSGDPNDPGYGVPDGSIDAEDFFFYLDAFVRGCG